MSVVATSIVHALVVDAFEVEAFMGFMGVALLVVANVIVNIAVCAFMTGTSVTVDVAVRV